MGFHADIIRTREQADYLEEKIVSFEKAGPTFDLSPTWCGSLKDDPAFLGLSDSPTSVEVRRLLDGMHPVTGDPLTQRHNTTRFSKEEKRSIPNRIKGHVSCLGSTKTVSIAALSADNVEVRRSAFETAVSLTLQVESHIKVRKRGRGVCDSVHTGKGLALIIPEFTSSAGDPHLHFHIVFLNVTRAAEGPDLNRYWAADFGAVMRSYSHYREHARQEIDLRLTQAGFKTASGQSDFVEIEALLPLVDRFSKARDQVHSITREALGPSVPYADEIRCRRKFAHSLPSSTRFDAKTQRLVWLSELTPDERQLLDPSRLKQGKLPELSRFIVTEEPVENEIATAPNAQVECPESEQLDHQGELSEIASAALGHPSASSADIAPTVSTVAGIAEGESDLAHEMPSEDLESVGSSSVAELQCDTAPVDEATVESHVQKCSTDPGQDRRSVETTEANDNRAPNLDPVSKRILDEMESITSEVHFVDSSSVSIISEAEPPLPDREESSTLDVSSDAEPQDDDTSLGDPISAHARAGAMDFTQRMLRIDSMFLEADRASKTKHLLESMDHMLRESPDRN